MNPRNKTFSIDNIASAWSNCLGANVFYLPVLGPVYISNKSVLLLLKSILLNSRKKEFLPYDKNKRWFNEKMEKILLRDLLIEDENIFVPLKDDFRNVLKVFYYSKNPANDEIIKKADSYYSEIIRLYKLKGIHFFCDKRPSSKKQFIVHNIYLKNINSTDKTDKFPEIIHSYDQLPLGTKSTFKNLGKEDDLRNFEFLWNYMSARKIKSDTVICAVVKNKIVGAIGPLDIEQDAFANFQLFPPHFGIIKKRREEGIGKMLWRSAMSFAYERGAKYTLVQNTPNSPASRFYEKQGLTCSGNIYSIFLANKKED